MIEKSLETPVSLALCTLLGRGRPHSVRGSLLNCRLLQQFALAAFRSARKAQDGYGARQRCPTMIMAQRVLVTGGNGLLAYALRTLAPADCEMTFLGREDFDLTAPARMKEWLETLKPEVVVNTAAYNLVEKCEQERDLSWAVNATGPETLAKLCAEKNVRLIHYGTDYVFDGEKGSPYTETDEPNPLNHYGAGKLAGERAVLAASPKHVVMRTSWVFGWHPTQTKSYVHAVLRAARAGNNLKATTDQASAPTVSDDLARWTVELIQKGGSGLFHAVNDEGVSRFDWTVGILEEAKRLKMVSEHITVEAVTSDYFKSPTRRPKQSILANGRLTALLGQSLGSWRSGLRKMLAQEASR
jgi:dTDP-4-dehydrorhamnose reductase